MTTEEKFKAAINVIRSLPKHGSYQPSTEMMLKFYKYFKQATEGPANNKSRPPFWDVVGRTKYDAWATLGNMSKEEAMKNYVDELHSIVETMSFTDKVANFLEAPTTELDSLNMSDLELIAGDVMERVRSQPNSPLTSRETSPQRNLSSLGTSPATSRSISISEDEKNVLEHSDDEYIDSIEVPTPPTKIVQNGIVPRAENPNYSNAINGLKEHKSRAKTRAQPVFPRDNLNAVDITTEIRITMDNLKAAVENLTEKVNCLDKSSREANETGRKQNWGWFLSDMRPHLFLFFVAWPFVATLITNRLYFSNKKRT